jgi:hypothetical protein
MLVSTKPTAHLYAVLIQQEKATGSGHWKIRNCPSSEILRQEAA